MFLITNDYSINIIYVFVPQVVGKLEGNFVESVFSFPLHMVSGG